jgi:hypothetical protein
MKKPTKRKCKVCQSVFDIKQTLQAVCSYKCAIEYSKKIKANKEAQEWKKQKAVLKEKIKNITNYKNDARKHFQKFIRLRDALQPCISCGTYTAEQYDGGHYKKAEIYSGVIFNEMNCHKQCRKCNNYLNGNELLFREGLIKRYGVEYVETIEKLANETRQKKWTKNELIAKKIQYDLKIKELLK